MSYSTPVPHSHKFSNPCLEPRCRKFASRAMTDKALPVYCGSHAPADFVHVFKPQSVRRRWFYLQKNTPVSKSNIAKLRQASFKTQRVKSGQLRFLLCADVFEKMNLDDTAEHDEATVRELARAAEVERSLQDDLYCEETLPPSLFVF